MKTALGGSAAREGRRRHVGVAHLGVDAGGAKRVDDPAPGAQRNITLVGQTPGKYQNVHKCSMENRPASRLFLLDDAGRRPA